MVSASQVQQWPIAKLYELLGGGVNTFTAKNVKGSLYHRWCLYGPKAVELMMLLFPVMSPRRQDQIKRCLGHWATKPRKLHARNGYSREARQGLVNRVAQLTGRN